MFSLLVVVLPWFWLTPLSLAKLTETTPRSAHEIIKDCNGILYRLIVDSGLPPFPQTACDIKQNVIRCFELNRGQGKLLDEDRFLLLQSAIVDKALMCPKLKYHRLEHSIAHSDTAKALSLKYNMNLHVRCPLDKCAADIHKICEKTNFWEVVVNHLPWPKTTRWRDCYNKALQNTTCAATVLEKYSGMQEEFGERLRAHEYSLGLFGIFMNDNDNFYHLSTKEK